MSRLLPSAFSAGPRPRLQRNGAFNNRQAYQLSPPLSPPTPDAINSSSRTLQSVLGTSSQIHKSGRSSNRVLKRPPPRPRGGLKRGREEDDDGSREFLGHGYGLGLKLGESDDDESDMHDEVEAKFSTPKRRRHGPTSMPFGLERKDYLPVDEALDEAMVEDVPLPVPEVDEGYGSMDIQPSHISKMPGLCESVNPLMAPPDSPDAMSLSTPAVDLAALDLSTPQSQPTHFILQQQHSPPPLPCMPGITSVPSLAAPVVPREASVSKSPEVDLPEPEVPGAALPEIQQDSQSLPRLRPLPSRTHSDPITPCTPSTPPPTRSPAPQQRPARDRAHSWTDADDRALVELVVEKLRLKKREWEECARVLGADGYGASLGRRWRELVRDGCVGLKYRYSSGAGRSRRGDVRGVRWD